MWNIICNLLEVMHALKKKKEEENKIKASILSTLQIKTVVERKRSC